MPFGRRKFTTLINENGDWLARFVPIDMGADVEFVTEVELRRAFTENDAAKWPVDDVEEVEALRAFDRKYKRRTMRRPNREPVKPSKKGTR